MSRPLLPPSTVGSDGLPVHVSEDRTLRIKIIDACGLACVFCHNEGTAVRADNLRRKPGEFTAAGPSGRVSIYLSTNKAAFLPALITPNEDFTRALEALRTMLRFDEVHLTGGEPTLHPQIGELTARAVALGLRVSMTSNGENGARAIPTAAAAGLHRVNFSIFGTTPAELAQVQGAKYNDTRRADRKLQALRTAIDTALHAGIKVSANIVVPGHDHIDRVHRLLTTYSPRLSVRLLNSLDHGPASIDAITELLSDLNAEPIAHYLTAGASGYRTAYRLPDDRIVWFKQIRPVRLPQTCSTCRFNNDTDCQEGYYGIRLYQADTGVYQVGVCIQRMDLCLPLTEFISSPLCREVSTLRSSEYRQLTNTYRHA